MAASKEGSKTDTGRAKAKPVWVGRRVRLEIVHRQRMLPEDSERRDNEPTNRQSTFFSMGWVAGGSWLLPRVRCTMDLWQYCRASWVTLSDAECSQSLAIRDASADIRCPRSTTSSCSLISAQGGRGTGASFQLLYCTPKLEAGGQARVWCGDRCGWLDWACGEIGPLSHPQHATGGQLKDSQRE